MKRPSERAAAGQEKIRGLYYRADRGEWWYARMIGGVRSKAIPLRVFTPGEQGRAEAILALRKIAESHPLVEPLALMAEIRAFLDEKERLREYRRITREQRQGVLEQFARWARCAPRDVNLPKAEAYYRWLTSPAQGRSCSPNTANSHIAALQVFFSWLVEQRKVAENPFPKVKRIEVKQAARTAFLPFATYRKIIVEAPTDELRFIYFCGFECGMRKNEIVEAQPWWFDLNAATVHIQDHAGFRRKNGQIMPIPLTPEFVAFLRRWGLREPYCLAPEAKKGRWRYRYDFRRPFEEDMARHGVQCSAHTMRHSFGSFHAQNGVPLLHIARWMGDSLLTVERHYAHLQVDREHFERSHELARARVAPADESRIEFIVPHNPLAAPSAAA